MSEKLNLQLDLSKEINLKIGEQSRKFFEDAECVATVLEKVQQLRERINQPLTGDPFEQHLNDPLKKIHTRMIDILGEMQQHSAKIQPDIAEVG